MFMMVLLLQLQGKGIYLTATVKVCVPNEPEEKFAEVCESVFDCGYSILENRWSRCSSGRCIRAIEK